MTPSRPQIIAPAIAMLRRLFRITKFSVTCSELQGAPSGAEHQQRNQATKTYRQRIWQREIWILGHFKARHGLTRQQAKEKLRHAGHGLSHPAGVNHLANGENTTGERDDKKSLQDMRNADD